jgi:subfamily B ATP-binding cassette protein MsbA
MKSFRRSLKYLRPYRLRVALTLLCVIFISVLWAGGLSVLLPGAKVLLSADGLHGWAFQQACKDSIGITFVQLDSPSADAKPQQAELEVLAVAKDSPAGLAGIKKGQLITSAGAGSAIQILSQLAHTAPGAPVELQVRQAGIAENNPSQACTITAGQPKLWTKGLLALADFFPIPPSYSQRFPMLLWLVGFGVVITVVRNLVRFFQEYLVTSIIMREIIDIRRDNYNTVLRLPVTFFSKRGTTDSISRFFQDTAEVGLGHSALLGTTLVEPAKAIAALAVAMALNWKLTLIIVIALPPGVWMIRQMGKKMHQASRKALQSWSQMLAILQETLGGIKAVKTYTMEAAERKRFMRASLQMLRHQTKMAMIDAVASPIVETVGLIAAMAAVAWAGYYVLNDPQSFDREQFLALIACLGMVLGPTRRMGGISTRLHRADAAAGRVFELMDSRREKTSPTWPALARHNKSIEVSGVSFGYEDANAPALSDVNLSIPAGLTVAFVGPNGSGKTTLMSMVPRLLEPTSGRVLIDGVDIATVSLRSLRRQIAMVGQDTVIFNATIADNIAYGRRKASPQLIHQAADKAFVNEFVSQLPQGYDTMVGQRGSTLSGGQCQRIAIARAILRDPAILIFDEAMSQVDSESEEKIRQAMAQFVKGRTTLVVAHRLRTVLTADLIVVMDAGRIVATGSHEQLLQGCGLYQRLHQTQLQ